MHRMRLDTGAEPQNSIADGINYSMGTSEEKAVNPRFLPVYTIRLLSINAPENVGYKIKAKSPTNSQLIDPTTIELPAHQ